MRGIPRTEKEVTKSLTQRIGARKKEALKSLRKTRKVLIKELELEVPRPRPKEYIDRFSSQLGILQEVRAEAHEICASLPEKFKNRKASFLVAAAIIYSASQKFQGNVKIREISEVLNVGVSSVSKTGQRVRELSSKSEE